MPSGVADTGVRQPPAEYNGPSNEATSVAARLPKRMAPFMVPDVSSAVSLPAQCSRSTGSRRIRPDEVHASGAHGRVGAAGGECVIGGYLIQFNHTSQRLFEQIGALDLVRDLSAPNASFDVTRRTKKITTINTDGFRLARRGDLVGVRRLAVEAGRSEVYTNGRLNLWVDVPGRLAGSAPAALLLGPRAAAQVFSYPHIDETLVMTSVNVGADRAEKNELQPAAVDLLRGDQYWRVVRSRGKPPGAYAALRGRRECTPSASRAGITPASSHSSPDGC